MMTPVVSVIACVYNALPVARESLQSVIDTLPAFCELILVDNHSPDPETRAYLRELELGVPGKIIRVVDPGSNVGCHHGWNYGYNHCEAPYVCKLDDDTIVLEPRWAMKMVSALDHLPQVAYLSADIDAKQQNKYRRETMAGHEIEIAESGIVGFSFVMFRRADIERWGPMKGRGGPGGLYGGEEAHYAAMARADGRLVCHFPPVLCRHAGNELRHPDYPMWKRAYGYRGWTKLDLEAWVKSGKHVGTYEAEIWQECEKPEPNPGLLLDWVRRLGQLGTIEHLPAIERARIASKNESVGRACTEAARRFIDTGSQA